MAALGVNTSEYDFSGMTAAEKLQLLREIRRICEEMMATVGVIAAGAIG